jgi:P4 family phage/plasmid primase-like protien
MNLEVEWSRGDHVEIAQQTLGELRGDGEPLVFDEGALCRYQPATGLWKAVDLAAQSCVIQRFAGAVVKGEGKPKPLKIHAGDVTGSIKLAHDQAAKPGFFADGRPGIAFANGFVKVSAKSIVKHRHAPDNRARYGYPFRYKRAVAGPMFLKFLHSLFRDDGDREEKISLLQEFWGASLLGIATKYQRAVIAQGDGENGKNALADVMMAAFPPDAVAALAPQHFESEYRRAMLAGKRINVVSELPEAEIIASESFKAIVTGDMIDGRHIREAPFNFRAVAGHFFCANELPGTADQTPGFWRRFLVVTFKRSFRDDPERDPHIARKIIDKELPSIVAWMIVGAQRLMREGVYTIPSSHYAAMTAWQAAANPVASFLAEEARDAADGEAGTPAAILYNRFRNWCSTNGHKPMSSAKFGRRMRLLNKGSKSDGTARMHPVVLT